MKENKVIAWTTYSMEGIEEYKIFSREEFICILNGVMGNDPVIIAFMDLIGVDRKKYPQYKIDKQTGQIILYFNSTLKKHYPYEWENAYSYIKRRYGNFREV